MGKRNWCQLKMRNTIELVQKLVLKYYLKLLLKLLKTCVLKFLIFYDHYFTQYYGCTKNYLSAALRTIEYIFKYYKILFS